MKRYTLNVCENIDVAVNFFQLCINLKHKTLQLLYGVHSALKVDAISLTVWYY